MDPPAPVTTVVIIERVAGSAFESNLLSQQLEHIGCDATLVNQPGVWLAVLSSGMSWL